MAFPTSPSDGDEYTNVLGTVYKYQDTDDKWYIISTALNIVLDTTPQLGGALDTNGNNITMTGAETVDGVDISALSITNMPTAVNNWMMHCTNGSGVMTELATGASGTFLIGNGATSAPSFQSQPAPIAHVHDGDTLQLDGVNSDGGAFSFTTTGTVTFNQAITTQGLLTADGVVPEGDLVDSLGTTSLTWLDLFVQDIKDAAGNTILSNDGAGNIDVLAPLSTNITFTGAQTVDGKDVSGLATTAESVQAVEDAGLVLSASKSINIDGTPADATYTGIVLDIDTTGCATYDAVYIDGVNSVLPAKADAIGTMPCIGVVVASGKVLILGVVRIDATFAVAADKVVYVDEDTAGDLKDAVPGSVGDIVQVIGYTVGTDMIYINPSLDWVIRQ